MNFVYEYKIATNVYWQVKNDNEATNKDMKK